MRRENIILTLFIIVLLVGGAATGQSLVVTTTGREYSGNISGINAIIRLDIVPDAGPVNVFDIPLSSIKQITIDFPRLIVETKDKVYIGPFSAFTGIAETLKVGETSIPLAGIRAIALNGNPIHSVPREWLGDRFLTGPRVSVRSVQGPMTEETNSTATSNEKPINWAKINPTPAVVPETNQGMPWWSGILIVAGLALLLYLSLVAGTSSSQ